MESQLGKKISVPVILTESPNIRVDTKLQRIPPMDAYIAADMHVTGDIGLRCEPNCLSLYRSIDRTAEKVSITAAGITGDPADAVSPWVAFVALLSWMSISVTDHGEARPSFKYTGDSSQVIHWYFLPGLNGQVISKTPVLGGNSHDAREFLSQCYSELPWDTEASLGSKRYLVRLKDSSWFTRVDFCGHPVSSADIREARVFSAAEVDERQHILTAISGSQLYSVQASMKQPVLYYGS